MTGGTGVPFDAAAHRARRAHCGEAVLIVDVDQFAAIRARHGTTASEQVTRAVAECLRRRLRPDDRLALLRDDEFLVVLPGAPSDAVPTLATRLRTHVQALRLSLAGSVWSLSCTIGAASRGSRPCGLEALVRAADADLDRARRDGAGSACG
jgi:two-component system chemotaxis family response regulator WspR